MACDFLWQCGNFDYELLNPCLLYFTPTSEVKQLLKCCTSDELRCIVSARVSIREKRTSFSCRGSTTVISPRRHSPTFCVTSSHSTINTHADAIAYHYSLQHPPKVFIQTNYAVLFTKKVKLATLCNISWQGVQFL